MFLGHSVCCKVHGSELYMYVSCPPGMAPNDLSIFHQILDLYGPSLGEEDYLLVIFFLHLPVLGLVIQGKMRGANRNSNVPKIYPS